MKNRNNEYRKLSKFPSNAITVSEYARERGCNTANIYKHWRKVAEGKSTPQRIGFEIVVFQDINFVLR